MRRQTLTQQLAEVRAQIAALKAEEDSILAELKRHGWLEAALIEGGVAAAAYGVEALI